MYPEQEATQSTGALEKRLHLEIERVTRTKEARHHDGEVGHARQEQEYDQVQIQELDSIQSLEGGEQRVYELLMRLI